MRARYLIAAFRGDAPPPLLLERMSRAALDMVFARDGCAVFVNDGCRWLDLGSRGVVLGTLFDRHGPGRARTMLDADERQAILSSNGASLLDRFWGRYVAALAMPQGLRVQREPSAAMPCYYLEASTSTLLASDVELLCVASGEVPAIDWDGLAMHLHGGALPTARTALVGVRELLAGFAIEVGANCAVPGPCWSPWDHARIDASDAAANIERLSRTVRASVRASTAPYPKLLLSVSGGLDSSIVAAAVAGAGRDVRCITMYSDDPDGDERSYARDLCAHLGFDLIECRYDPLAVDIREAVSPHLPRPSGRTLSLAFERCHLAAAVEHRMDAFVTGVGGDNIFGYSQSASAVADRYLAQGLTKETMGSLFDVCRQTGCGPLQAARAAIRAVRSAARPYRWRTDASMLAPARAAALSKIPFSHPWLEAPAWALPGQKAHVAALLRSQQTLEPRRSTHAPVLAPLLTQPVIELCLRIPSWQWRAGGRDRSAARAAFAADLPAPLLERREKGGPDGFSAQLIAIHYDAVRERLLGGALVSRGIVDAGAVARALAEGPTRDARSNVRIQELLATEAWIDHWRGRDEFRKLLLDASAAARSASH